MAAKRKTKGRAAKSAKPRTRKKSSTSKRRPRKKARG